jgi:hypothetical protein
MLHGSPRVSAVPAAYRPPVILEGGGQRLPPEPGANASNPRFQGPRPGRSGEPGVYLDVKDAAPPLLADGQGTDERYVQLVRAALRQIDRALAAWAAAADEDEAQQVLQLIVDVRRRVDP